MSTGLVAPIVLVALLPRYDLYGLLKFSASPTSTVDHGLWIMDMDSSPTWLLQSTNSVWFDASFYQIDPTPPTMCDEKGYMCLGVGCTFSRSKWSNVERHMNDCSLYHDDSPPKIRDSRRKFRAWKCKSVIDKAKSGVNDAASPKGGTKKKKKNKKKKKEAANASQGKKKKNQKMAKKKSNPNNEQKLPTKSSKGKLKELQRMGVVIPFVGIKLTLTPPKQAKPPSQPTSTLRDRYDTQWQSWSMEEYHYRKRTAGARRGAKKLLRQDLTWCRWAAKPPPKFTHHAKQRLMERGKQTMPRFVSGTNRSIVATVVPRTHEFVENHRCYLSRVRRRCWIFHRQRHRVERKVKAFKRTKKRGMNQKKLLANRAKAMKAADFVKSGSAYFLAPSALNRFNRPCKRPTQPYLALSKTLGAETIIKITNGKKKKEEKTSRKNQRAKGAGARAKAKNHRPDVPSVPNQTNVRNLKAKKMKREKKKKSKKKQHQEKSKTNQAQSLVSCRAPPVIRSPGSQDGATSEPVVQTRLAPLGSNTKQGGVKRNKKMDLWKAMDEKLSKN